MSARDDLRAKRRRAKRHRLWQRRTVKWRVSPDGEWRTVVTRHAEALERELLGIPGLVTAETDYPPVFQGVMPQKVIDMIEHRNAVFQSILDDTFRGDVNARWEGAEITVNGDTRTVASYRGHEGPNPWLDPPPGAVIDSWMHHGACPCPACLVRDGELKP